MKNCSYQNKMNGYGFDYIKYIQEIIVEENKRRLR